MALPRSHLQCPLDLQITSIKSPRVSGTMGLSKSEVGAHSGETHAKSKEVVYEKVLENRRDRHVPNEGLKDSSQPVGVQYDTAFPQNEKAQGKSSQHEDNKDLVSAHDR